MARACCLLLLLLLSCVRACGAVFRVVAPASPSSALGAGIAHQAALFGPLAATRSLVAPLVLAPETNRRACSAFNRSELLVLANDEATGGDTGANAAFVLLVERGECHFVEKVRHAQQAAAAGVVVFNTASDDDSGTLPAMADDGSAGDIRIPSLLIHRRDALALIDLMRTARKVVVLINREEWVATTTHQQQQQERDTVVDVALWSSARSAPAMQAFIRTFAHVARAIDEEDDEKKREQRTIRFTPYFDVFEGSAWGCTAFNATAPEDDDSDHCAKLCLYDNKYCTFDPERDSNIGLDGKDVLEEDVRQLCVAQYAREATKNGNNALFLDYVAAFNAKCSPLDATATNGFNEECSHQVLALLHIPSPAITKCVSDQGEALLASQVAAKRKFGVFTTPQFTVNGEALREDTAILCEEPISLASCPPLRKLCLGFEERTKRDAETTLRVCSAAFWHDACFKPLERDACGDCNLREDTARWNRKCAGCDGVPHSGKDLDECGVCGGTGSFDVCGRCLPEDDAQRGKSCVDCKGVPNGNAKVDPCGVCDGRGSFDACGLCFDIHDPRRQSHHCRVVDDPDAVRGKVQITGVSSTEFRGHMLGAFQRAVGAVAHVSATEVLLKSVLDSSACDSKDGACTELFFFVPCPDDACRASTAKLLQDPSASLAVAMKMRANLDEVAYGLNEAASIEHVRLHSISSVPTGELRDDPSALSTSSSNVMLGQEQARVSTVGVVLGALCFITLVVGIVALRARDTRIRREFQQMFAAYTPLTSLDQESEREGTFT